MRILPLVLVFLYAAAPAASAQVLRFGVQAVTVTHDEIREGKRADGTGIGGSIEVRYGRLLFEGRGYSASLNADLPTDQDFDVRQLDGRLSVLITSPVAIEVGAGRRWIDPELAAQDVGFVRLGIRAENSVTRLARVWFRTAYLVKPEFSGGGDVGLAVEVGLGTAIGTPNGRFRVRGEFNFQRIDRKVTPPGGVELDVPIQLAVARFGIEFGI